MLTSETACVMVTELVRKLQEELRSKSYRDLESATGVSRGALEGIVRGKQGAPNTEAPRLETLDKLATYWKLPLWRVIEMSGVDLGLTRSVDETVQQLSSLAKRMPEIEPIVHYLLKLYPEDLRGVVAYLESLDRQRNRDAGWVE